MRGYLTFLKSSFCKWCTHPDCSCISR